MTDLPRLRLGVNIDHVATVRNARGGAYPDPLRAAQLAEEAGADGITAHLREDRRHISDADIDGLMQVLNVPLNFEMAATPEMQAIALRHKPHAVCIVPEKREERTTEGGLNAAREHNKLAPMIRQLRENGSRVSLFIEPDPVQLAAAKSLGADICEFHTGRYVELWMAGDFDLAEVERERIIQAARRAVEMGIEPQAGHGLTYDTVGPIAEIEQLTELNIGHFLMGEAIFIGLDAAVRKMRELMDEARA